MTTHFSHFFCSRHVSPSRREGKEGIRQTTQNDFLIVQFYCSYVTHDVCMCVCMQSFHAGKYPATVLNFSVRHVLSMGSS